MIILLTILPLVWIILAAINDMLGPNPVQKSIFVSGWWALFFLQLTITIPLIDRFFNTSFIKIRRELGLGTFTYSSIHLFIWLLIENYQDLENIINELILINYIFFGFIAYILLIPLTITSNNYLKAILGNTWKKIHLLVYVILFLSIIHYVQSLKSIYEFNIIFFLQLALIMIAILIRLKP